MNGLQANQILPSVLNANQSFGIEKKCSKCKEIKLIEEFYSERKSKDGRFWWCKKCVNEKNRHWGKTNPKKVRESSKRWRRNNPEKLKAQRRRVCIKTQLTFRGKLNRNISSSISRALCGNKKGRHWWDIVGYTLEQLRKHLEKQFKPGMTWNNYGRKGWHLDHRIPKSVFNYEKPEDDDFKRCWALKNLRPLWAFDNISKHNKLSKHFQPKLIFK